ncbi:MAG: tol-pal system protein YbgF [Deltaproteobacteria bacterium]|jgi:tol-pal system protein YbgF|nr:tol-pal system protein YbgF [Deltaproteobacteria bacterium]MDH4006658.1 tol-pal system protein YbgF [Desulfuromonadales bacterium]
MLQVRSLAILVAGLLLSSCVVTQQDLQMQRDLLEMKRRLAEAERAVKELQDDTSGGVRAHVETLAGNQADFQAELDGLRVDLQSMQGRTGDQERINDELRQDLTLLRDELSLQVADHEQRLAKLDAGMAAASAAPPAVSPSPTPAVAPPVATTPAGESAPELYDRALKKIREEQDFKAGRELMEAFLKRYPEHDLAVNAAYWIGETYYAEKNYEQAILQFEEIIQKYGDHPKVASAMLKQALAFESTGDQATAKLLLQRVIERYPLSDEAGKAKQKLQTL